MTGMMALNQALDSNQSWLRSDQWLSYCFSRSERWTYYLNIILIKVIVSPAKWKQRSVVIYFACLQSLDNQKGAKGWGKMKEQGIKLNSRQRKACRGDRPCPRRCASLTAGDDGKTLWMVGGNDGETSLSDVYNYKVDTASWAKVRPFLLP